MPSLNIPAFAPPAFTSEQDARAWMVATLHNDGEFCLDDERFAFLDDTEGMALYDEQREEGCCGNLDREVIVNGRRAMIGCSYGH